MASSTHKENVKMAMRSRAKSINQLKKETIKKEKAIALAGGIPELAEVLGVTPRAIYRWGEWMPSERYEQLYGKFCLYRFSPVDGQVMPELKTEQK